MNEDHFEELIKEGLHQHLQEVPDPPYSKEETWNQIYERLYGEQDKKRKKRLRRFGALSSVTGLLLIALLLMPQSGGAFGKIAEMFYQVQNAATQLFVSTEEPIEEIELQKGAEFGSTSGDMSLQEAQEHTNFDIIVPEYIPDGFKLQNVTVMTNEINYTSDHVILNYMGKKGSLEIEQSGLGEGFGMGMSANTDNAEKVMVGIKEVMLIKYEDQAKEAYWTTEDLFISIYGLVSEEDLLKVIESM